jgi:hypothetical protein
MAGDVVEVASSARSPPPQLASTKAPPRQTAQVETKLKRTTEDEQKIMVEVSQGPRGCPSGRELPRSEIADRGRWGNKWGNMPHRFQPIST